MTLDAARFPSPCYVIDLELLKRNARILQDVQVATGARILLALKGYATFSTFPLLRNFLAGTAASSLDEARLGAEEFGGEVHVYAPAYAPDDLAAYLEYSAHISFNSMSEWRRHRDIVKTRKPETRCGLRINPEHSEVEVALYDPCRVHSRLGITRAELSIEDLDGITGFHLHCLCGQNSDVLSRVLKAFEERFGEFLPDLEWLNLGGGHHISCEDYDVDLLCSELIRLRDTYDLQVFLEPGEAVALNAGFLVASVLDILRNEVDIAILNTSATAHMPDVLEMPYRPSIVGAGEPGELGHDYELGGLTCLAGDVIGTYSFPEPLRVGQRLVFTDMAHYSMVKNNTFNGVRLPSIATFDPRKDEIRIMRSFDYEDYRNRLS